jgi:hypothetical protein
MKRDWILILLLLKVDWVSLGKTMINHPELVAPKPPTRVGHSRLIGVLSGI